MYCCTVDYFSTCVNAGTMALVDAGIPLKDLVCACSATYIDDTPIIGKKNSSCTCILLVIFDLVFKKKRVEFQSYNRTLR